MRRLAEAAIVLACGTVASGVAHAGEPLSPAAFAASAAAEAAGDDAIGALVAKVEPASDAFAVDWRSSELKLAPKAALRLRIADPLAQPGARNLQPAGYGGAQAYEVSLVRDWPAAVSFETARFGVDLTPHAGVGVTSYGGLAEAGATVQLSERMDSALKKSLGAMGVRDGAAFGECGRLYLFAAASVRAVGLNMLRSDAGWSRAGWTTDQTSTLVGDAQVGVGWRKGAMQTSLGFIHREMKGVHTIYGQDAKADSLVAFSFSVKPRR